MMVMWYALLADVVVAVHVLYVGFVIVGQVLIGLGVLCDWRWVRHSWLRRTHVAAIGIVALEAILGVPCPLTVWEQQLRLLAGEEVSDASFIGRCLHGVLFYDGPPWVFTAGYVTFALLAVVTFVLASPRRTAGTVAKVQLTD
jgi:hypothetical protein